MMKKTTVKPDPAFAKPKGNAPVTRLPATLTDGTTKALWDFEHTTDLRSLLG